MPTNPTIACSLCGRPMWKTDLAAVPTCRGCRSSGIRRAAKPRQVIGCSEPVWPTCWTCGVGMARRRGTRYCSPKCQPSAQLEGAAKQRRRERIRTTSEGPIDREYVFQRDRWTCHICGGQTDSSKRVPDALAPTIDHLIPLAAGGRHVLANVSTAHFECNALKGARGGGEQLMLVG